MTIVTTMHADHDGDEVLSLPGLTLVINDDGWLSGSDMERVPTERTQPLVYEQVVGVCWHWTATRGVGHGLAERIAKLPRPGERAASWGTLIPREGPMIQSASMQRGTWHCGGPSAAAFSVGAHGTNGDDNLPWARVLSSKAGLRWGLSGHDMTHRTRGEVSGNSLLHGVELENLGEVRAVRGTWRAFPFTDSSPECPRDEVEEHEGKCYHSYSKHQATQAERIVRALHDAYGLNPESFLFTHQAIDPTRKTDPGPLWSKKILPGIIDDVF